ncbi:M48 family metallopeptidase [Streptacidiphilus pinicola]|uniref:M48 family metallopeptidase n=1 Tax=Streptacidiphilus pinicola TaxID=2219663 RepID=UPI001403158F|nr:M48 family metallopeptidase [Streptacidiphilus pinicola]
MRRRLDQTLEQRLFDEASSGRELRPRRGAGHLAAVLLALPVHLVTVAALVGAVLLMRFGAWTADLAAVALLGVAYLGRPRLGDLARTRKSGHPLSRKAAPQLWALADSVAEQLGTRAPGLILVDARYNASYARVGWRRRVVLRLGLPLWLSLTEQERVALLAHEFGHGVNGDSRRGVWLGAALGSLSEWVRLLRPARGGVRVRGGMEALAALLARGLMSFLSALVELYLRLLDRATRLDSRRAEYLADSYTVRLAGGAGAAGLLEALHLRTAFETVTHQARMAARQARAQARGRAGGEARGQADGPQQPDLWVGLTAYVRSIPAEERARRVIAAELTHDDFDTTHPPTHLRLAFVRGLPASEPAVVLDVAASAAIDAELRPVGRSLEAALLDR